MLERLAHLSAFPALACLITAAAVLLSQEKPATLAPAPTVESLSKDLADARRMADWQAARADNLQLQLNGLQQYCSASLQFQQINAAKPVATPIPPPSTSTPSTENKKK